MDKTEKFNNTERILRDMLNAYKHTSDYKDSVMTEIILRRAEFEKILDDMWDNYRRGNMQQVVEYKRQVKLIKEAGLVVQRHKATGKHRIIYG